MFTYGDLARASHAGLTNVHLRNAELEAEVAELRQALRRAEATARRSAVGAHDIRNALTVIQAETELLASSLRGPDQRESIRALTSATRIVASIAQEMLVSARKPEWRLNVGQRRPALASPVGQQALDKTVSEARPAEASPVEVNIGELLESCRALIERMLEPSLECKFVSSAGLWPITVPPERFEAALQVRLSRDCQRSQGSSVKRSAKRY